jgi:hypothetical protein
VPICLSGDKAGEGVFKSCLSCLLTLCECPELSYVYESLCHEYRVPHSESVTATVTVLAANHKRCEKRFAACLRVL